MVAYTACRGDVSGWLVDGLMCQVLRGGTWRVVVNRAACRGIAPDTSTIAWREIADAGAVILENAASIQQWLQTA